MLAKFKYLNCGSNSLDSCVLDLAMFSVASLIVGHYNKYCGNTVVWHCYNRNRFTLIEFKIRSRYLPN